MNCKEAEFIIYSCSRPQDLLETNTELASHLKSCPDCSAKYEKTAKLEMLLSIKKDEHPPQGYWDKFSACMETKMQEDSMPDNKLFINKNRYWGMAMAAGIIGVLFGAAALWSIMSFQNNNNAEQPRQTLTNVTAQAPDVNLYEKKSHTIKKQEIMFNQLQDYLSNEVTWVASDGANTELGINDRPIFGKSVSIAVEIFANEDITRKELISAPLFTVIEGQQANVILPVESIPGTSIDVKCRPIVMKDKTIRVDFELHMSEKPSRQNHYESRTFGLDCSYNSGSDDSYVGEFIRDGKKYTVFMYAGLLKDKK